MTDARTTTSANAVEVLTHEYEWTHGTKPRGRGAWAFTPWRSSNLGDVELVYGSYSEAKREAKRLFAAKGVSVVVVLG